MAEVKFPTTPLPQASDRALQEKENKEASKAAPSTPPPERTHPMIVPPKTKKSKLASIFRMEGKSFSKYLVDDVVKPMAADTAYDFGMGMLGTLIYKDPNAFRKARRTRGALGSVLGPVRDYASMSRPRTREPYGIDSRLQNSRVNGNNIMRDLNMFDSYEDAYWVLCEMRTLCLDRHLVTIADFYALVEELKARDGITLPPPDYTYSNYGWASLDNAYISRNGLFYTIEMARPRQLR